jgi:predicted dithiol-disulfide oxidoreductase (DUF899 family)
MTEHRIGTQAEWQAERDTLLAEEKELTRRGDDLAEKRRGLPWVRVEKDYRFETEADTKSLADLFDGRSQLLVYHFMFGPSFEAGCPVCSSIADTLTPQVPHLKARDATLVLASRAPLAKLTTFRGRMGWAIDWVSSGGSDFNRDIGFLHTEDELKSFLEGEIPPTVEQNARMCGTSVADYVAEGPGLSVYALSDRTVASLSNALALVVRQRESLIGVVTSVTLPLTFLSTAFMQQTLVPNWIRWVARFNPVNWAVQAGRSAATQHTDWNLVLTRTGLLTGLLLVSAWLATRSFNAYQRSI